jgi:hypothetical protein
LVLAKAMRLRKKPTQAKGMFSQFRKPKKGMKPMSRPNKDNKPQITLIAFIIRIKFI